MIRPSYYEFFAGGGMVRAALGKGWRCLFANDVDGKKAAAYRENWGDAELKVADIATLKASDLPGHADLAWASFPCQDLSLAGMGKGLKGERSGTFFAFIRLMQELAAEGRAPKIIALENVVGLLTSHGGEDFAAVTRELVALGYCVGAMVIDAAHFVPQSRPRVFFVAVRDEPRALARFTATAPSDWCASAALKAAAGNLRGNAAGRWMWWRLPEPARRNSSFADVVETEPTGVAWHAPEQTARLMEMMSGPNLAKLEKLRTRRGKVHATAYRRTRPDGAGGKTQRVELRADGVAGCLRTPAGGSSRQIVLEIAGPRLRSRLLSPREAARLMGLDDGYRLPARYNDAYHLLGDGVAAAVVRYLGEQLLREIAIGRSKIVAAAE